MAVCPTKKVQYQIDRNGMLISRRVEPILNMIVYQFICIDLMKKREKTNLLFGSLSKNVVILMLFYTSNISQHLKLYDKESRFSIRDTMSVLSPRFPRSKKKNYCVTVWILRRWIPDPVINAEWVKFHPL